MEESGMEEPKWDKIRGERAEIDHNLPEFWDVSELSDLSVITGTGTGTGTTVESAFLSPSVALSSTSTRGVVMDRDTFRAWCTALCK